MTVRVERTGPVTTVVIDRPEARNAVDRATAEALSSAFREFDADDSAAVAVLWGAGGTFCAGADLKQMSNRVAPDGDGPMGPSRLVLSKPVIAAVAGHAVAAGSSSRAGATCGSSSRAPCSASSPGASACR
jgi:Enoyl-CoA hydratase/carnithine racemase